jgi:GNAT superfamily N-acetyltransferase
MPVELKEVANRKDLKKFIYLPEKIHREHPTWVPPIYMDEWTYFKPEKNKAFSYCDTTIQLAYRDGEVVGRIMGIINQRYNETRNEKTGRFAYLECWNDQDVAHELLRFVENWAKRKGMTKIVGPYGFSDQDPEGFQIEGFENLATIATYHNFKYMIDLVEKEGYTKDVDYFTYKVDIPDVIPEFYHKIFKRITRSGEFKLLEFTKTKQVKPYIRPVFRLMNECYSHIYGFAPLTDQEMDDLAKRYLPILDPRFVKAVIREGEIISFIVGIPNMSEGIKKAKGHILPFGIFQILRAAKKTKQLDLLLGAVKDEYRGRGLDVMMGFKTLESAKQAGFEFLDSHHELESNTKIRAEMERMGGKVYKKFRVFQKQL